MHEKWIYYSTISQLWIINHECQFKSNLIIHFSTLRKIIQNKPTVWHGANVISGLICYVKSAKIHIDKITQVKRDDRHDM